MTARCDVTCGDRKARRWSWPRETLRAAVGVAALLLLACAVLPGCNILGPAGYFIMGPEKQPAVYTLDPQKVGVIVIDDKVNVTPQRSLREIIGRTAEEEILTKNLVKDMVKSSQALAVLSRERFGERMTIAELGKSLQADVVIYCTMDDFSLTQDGQSVTPESAMRVKIVDVKTSERVFPGKDATEWYPLKIKLPAQSMEKPSGSAILQNQQDLARLTGLALARMFYEHIPNEPDRLKEIR